MAIVSGLRPTSEQGTNPKDAYGLAKVPFSVIPTASLVFMARSMGVGAAEYGPHNWRVSKVQGRIYLEAAFRHLLALLDGEDFDPKTGLHHGGFVMATMGIYLDALVNDGLIDNRVIPGRTGELISAFNEAPNQKYTPAELRSILNTFLSIPAQEIHRIKLLPALKPDNKGKGEIHAQSPAESVLHSGNLQHASRARVSTRSNRRKRVGNRRRKRS